MKKYIYISIHPNTSEKIQVRKYRQGNLLESRTKTEKKNSKNKKDKFG